MITRLTVLDGSKSTVLYTKLNNGTEPYYIRSIEGLDPIKATINTANYAVVSGGFFTGSSVGTRNIVLSLAFNPYGNSSVPDIRRSIYNTFRPESKLSFTFALGNSGPYRVIDGYIESVETNSYFSTEIAATVSIICPEPFFRNTTATTVQGTANTNTNNLSYLGDVPTGFVFTMNDLAAATNGTIDLKVATAVNATPDYWNKITTDLAAGADFYLNTNIGDKIVTVNNASVFSKFIPGTTGKPRWPLIAPNLGAFVVTAPSATPWTLTYYERYSGL